MFITNEDQSKALDLVPKLKMGREGTGIFYSPPP